MQVYLPSTTNTEVSWGMCGIVSWPSCSTRGGDHYSKGGQDAWTSCTASPREGNANNLPSAALFMQNCYADTSPTSKWMSCALTSMRVVGAWTSKRQRTIPRHCGYNAWTTCIFMSRATMRQSAHCFSPPRPCSESQPLFAPQREANGRLDYACYIQARKKRYASASYQGSSPRSWVPRVPLRESHVRRGFGHHYTRAPRSASHREAKTCHSHFSCFLIFDFAEFLTCAHTLRYAFKHSGLRVRVLRRTISPFRNGLSFGMSMKISDPS